MNQLDLHFGLADATVIDSIHVAWPSGTTDHYFDVPVDQSLTYVECTDTDGDGIGCGDNCPSIANQSQTDSNGDGFGDACCCVGTTGNVDCDMVDGVDIGDLTTLIDNLFITFAPLCCSGEANVDDAGGTDIGDLTALIDNLFITFTPLPNCP